MVNQNQLFPNFLNPLDKNSIVVLLGIRLHNFTNNE